MSDIDIEDLDPKNEGALRVLARDLNDLHVGLLRSIADGEPQAKQLELLSMVGLEYGLDCEAGHPFLGLVAKAHKVIEEAPKTVTLSAHQTTVRTLHSVLRSSQAAYAAGLRDGPEACMEWLGNALGDLEAMPTTGPEWYSQDAETQGPPWPTPPDDGDAEPAGEVA